MIRQPSVDVSDEGDAYQVLADVPGTVKDDVEIAPGPLPGTMLLRAHPKEAPRPKTPLRIERTRSIEGARFERVVPVGWDADVARADATVENGVLRVTVPKQKMGAERKAPPPGPETR